MGKSPDLHLLLLMVENYLNSYKITKQKFTYSNLLFEIKWKLLASSKSKLLVDVALELEQNKIGIRDIITNYSGHVVAALSNKLDGCVSP